jgi:hypothetical protein
MVKANFELLEDEDAPSASSGRRDEDEDDFSESPRASSLQPPAVLIFSTTLN